MKQMSVIGCGRWGTFLGWYVANYCDAETVLMYDMPNSRTYLQLQAERKNEYLTLSDNMFLTSDISEALKNDFIIISISWKSLRLKSWWMYFCKKLNKMFMWLHWEDLDTLRII